MTDIAPITQRQRLGILVILGVVCAFGLFDHSLWSSNDTREGAMIREMVRTGSWVTPLFNGKAYLEKPPLLHWTGAVLCKVFGTVNEGLVRLPAALYGFGTLLLVWVLARWLGCERGGITAAFLCATSLLFFEYSRIVLTDMALTFMVLASLVLFWWAYAAPAPARWRYGVVILVSAVSFYAKGLLGPGFVWVSVCLFLVWQRRWALMLGLCLAFVPVFVLVLAPWVYALWKSGGQAFLYGVFWENQFGRFLSFNDPSLPLDPYYVHKEPFYFYFMHVPVRLLPWTLLVIASLVYWFRRSTVERGPLAGFLRITLVTMALVLHASSAKAACYLLPLFPVLFLMTGVWLERAGLRGYARWECGVIGLMVGAAGLMLVLAPIGYVVIQAMQVDVVCLDCPWTVAAGTGLSLLALGLTVYVGIRVWRQWQAGDRVQAVLWAPMLIAVLVIPTGAAFLPIVDRHRTYLPIVDPVRGEMARGRHMALVGDRERDCGALMFYLDSRITVLPLTGSAVLTFLSTSCGSSGVVVDVGDLKRLEPFLNQIPCRVVAFNHSGHKASEFRMVLHDSP